jgi:hypothetical protein
VDQRLLGVELLAGDRVLGGQPLVALEVDAGVVEQGLVARELALELRELGLERAGIDLGQEITLVDELPSWNRTLMSWPSTRVRMVTVLSGVTEPSPVM